MAWDIRWDLLGKAKDPGQSFSEGVEEGRARADQTAQRGALSVLAGDPSNTEALGVLTSINPQVGLAYQTNALKQADAARDGKLRGVLSNYYRQHAGGGSVLSPSGTADAPPISSAMRGGSVSGGPDEVTVAAAPSEPQVGIADIAALDPSQVPGAIKAISDMSDAQHKQLETQTKLLGSLAYTLKSAPADKRQNMIDIVRPQLLRAGFSQQEIDSADLSDEGLDALSGIAIDADKQLADHRQAQGQAITVRGQDVSAATQRAGQAVTMRGQDMSAATQRRGQDMSAATAAAGQAGTGQKTEVELRKEFNALPQVKDFNEIRTQYHRIAGLQANGSAQNDIAMVFSYMKMLDPGSVVREGEFATAQNAAGIPERIRNQYNKAASGNILSADQRAEIKKSASDVYHTAGSTYNGVARQYRGYASDYGAAPEHVALLSKVGFEEERKAKGGGKQVTPTIKRID